ncbi:MAG TPA: metallopeptidase family protein [Bryobacterales bacterium]|nr:metallopeptidase family protein [Bryobacterales bacterium]
MQRDEFEQLVHQAWLRIPKRFRRRVHNVGIVVEDEPSWELLRSSGVPPGHTLLGLYQGIPLTQRGASYGMVLPDKISLFQGPIERAARHAGEIPQIVYDTLWHEVAHYFGMNEGQVQTAERRRGRVR